MDYQYIDILSVNHLLYLTTLLLIAWLLFTHQSWIREHHQLMTNLIVVISIGQQLLLYSSYLLFEGFTLGESLPLHLSRINTLLGITFLLGKNKKLFSLIAYFSLFAWLSFLYPSNVQPITHPLGISFLVNHVITLLLPFYIMIAYQIQVKSNDKNVAYAWLCVYIVLVYLLNPILDGNYFYLVDRPIFKHLNEPLYMANLFIFCYLIFYLGDKVFTYASKQLIIPKKHF